MLHTVLSPDQESTVLYYYLAIESMMAGYYKKVRITSCDEHENCSEIEGSAVGYCRKALPRLVQVQPYLFGLFKFQHVLLKAFNPGKPDEVLIVGSHRMKVIDGSELQHVHKMLEVMARNVSKLAGVTIKLHFL